MSKAKRFLKVLKIIGMVLEGLIILLAGLAASVLYTVIMWVFKTWNHLTMDELMYQLRAPMQGTNTEMVMDALSYCLPVVAVVFFAIVILLIVLRKSWGYHVFGLSVLVISGLVAWWTISYTENRLDVETYIEEKTTYSDFITENYVDPAEVEITFPEKKRNLIHIYLESMETTYADKENGGGFDQNCIPELTDLAQQNEDFSGMSDDLNGGFAMPETTWTVAAMWAQSSGLPLTIPLDDNGMNTQEHFFPQVTSLGDILEEEGYSQTLLIGSEAVFGGRLQLFTDHGDFAIHDYTYAIQEGLIPADYRVWWGYEDKRLFEFAKTELERLSEQDEPFNLTMLTVDTHFEDGYVCDICGNEFGDNQYANVMACSSRQVGEFIKWVQQQDFYENTTIVIVGDHPTMDSDFCQNVDENYVRNVYTAYINSAVTPENPSLRREFTTYDYFPTTVAALGAQIEGNRLGLGSNLFSSQATLMEQNGRETMRAELRKKSELMSELSADIHNKPTDPTGTLTLAPYDEQTGIFALTIGDFQNLNEGETITGVNLAVFSEDNKSDRHWMSAEPQPDGTFLMNIRTEWFGELKSVYTIKAYLITDNNGTRGRYMIGETNAYVDQ